MITIRWLLPLLVLSLSCQSGGSGTPPVPEQKFVRLYADLLRNAQRGRDWGLPAEIARQGVDSLLAREGVTREEMQKAVEWYNADPVRWKTLLEGVMANLDTTGRANAPLPQ